MLGCAMLCLFLAFSHVYFRIMQIRGKNTNKNHKPASSSQSRFDALTQTVSDPGLYLHFHQYSGILSVKIKAPPLLNISSFCIAKNSNAEARPATPPVRGTRTFHVWFTVLHHFKADVPMLLLNKVTTSKSCCLFNNNLHHHHLSNAALNIRQ